MNALEIKNLSVSFLMYDKGIKKKALKVISDLSISIKPGEIHAVIGSSGSGKSLLAHALLGILPKNAITTGEMNWFGEKLTPALQKKLRGEQMVLVPTDRADYTAFLEALRAYAPESLDFSKEADYIPESCDHNGHHHG